MRLALFYGAGYVKRMKQQFPWAYRAQTALTKPAMAGASAVKVLLGVVFIGFVSIVGTLVFVWAIIQVVPDMIALRLLADLETLETPEGVLVLFFSFATLWLGAIGATVLLHGQAGMSLIGAPGAVLWQFRKVLLALVLLNGVLVFLLSGSAGEPLQRGMDLSHWFVWLLPALIALLIQTGGEEIVFRGYLQSQLSALHTSPVVWIGVPSVLFGMAHYAPETYGSNTWMIVCWAALFGAFAADLTARSGTLGPAIAFHFVNNVVAILLVSPEDEMSGLALYNLPFSVSDEASVRSVLVLDLGVMFVSWLTARIALRR